jgi:isopentenyl diphosphate isomerase/L-lactate dehydrogenase-like FMN-dependent dehydrogenase
MLSRRAALGGLITLPSLLPRVMAAEPTTVADASRNPHRPSPRRSRRSMSWISRRWRVNNLPPAHFGYIATGVDDDRTVVRNHDAFAQYEIRARRFNDLRQLSTATSVFGISCAVPSTCPRCRPCVPSIPMARWAWPVQRAAARRSSCCRPVRRTHRNRSPKHAARRTWQQLYPTDDWTVAEQLIRRAEKAAPRPSC